jgi:hypothetical protein
MCVRRWTTVAGQRRHRTGFAASEQLANYRERQSLVAMRCDGRRPWTARVGPLSPRPPQEALYAPNSRVSHRYRVHIAPAAPVISQHHSGPALPEPFPQYTATVLVRQSAGEVTQLLAQVDRASVRRFRDALGKLVVHHEH